MNNEVQKLDAEIEQQAVAHTYEHGVLVGEPELEFGSRLQNLRESKGLTQEQLADATKLHDPSGKGLSRAVISLYERGTNRPGLKELRILSEIFRTNPAYFLYGTDDPFESLFDKRRFGRYATSNPEFLAVLTYTFGKLHHHHKESIMDLMNGLILGWTGVSPESWRDEAVAYFIEAADELRRLETKREAQRKK